MTGASPDVARCNVFGNSECGVFVGRHSQIRLSHCNVFRNGKGGIAISKGGSGNSSSTVTTPVHGGGGSSISLSSSSMAQLAASMSSLVEDCDIYDNGGTANVHVQGTCRLLHNRFFGSATPCHVVVERRASCELQSNEMCGAPRCALLLEEDSSVQVSQNTLHSNGAGVTGPASVVTEATLVQSNNIADGVVIEK